MCLCCVCWAPILTTIIHYFQGVKALSKVLRSNSHVKKVNLQDNDLGDAAISMLCHALSTRETAGNSLLDLNLSQNNIGQAGALTIAQILHSNKSMTSLRLSWNNIRGAGADSLARSLAMNSTLRTLDLSWNFFGGKAVRQRAVS